MKKNLILFGTFIFLLVLVYFFQEKRVEREVTLSDKEGKLITKPISHLKWNNIDASRGQNGQWKSGENLLSYNSLNVLEKKISEIKIMKPITGEWKNYFPEPVTIEVDKVEWTFGSMNLDKTGFYLARGKDIMLARVEGESQMTMDGQEIEQMKLDEIKSHLTKNLNDVIEKQLFRYYSSIPLHRVVIEAEGYPSFELNLKKNETIPKPMPGISILRKINEKLLSLLTQVTIKDLVNVSENDLLKQMGKILFFGESGKPVTWELWLKNKNSGDVYLLDPDQHKTYLMVGGTLKLFFIQVQDYWDKKIIPPTEFKSFDELPVIFIQGTKSSKVMVKNREPLTFESKEFKVNIPTMDSLFQLLFNLRQFDQAERVSLLSASERKMILSLNLLRIEIMGQEVYLWRKKEELIVVNLTQGFKAHFTMLDENFHGTFEDVLK